MAEKKQDNWPKAFVAVLIFGGLFAPASICCWNGAYIWGRAFFILALISAKVSIT